MIYTITFNPSLDYVITVKDFSAGKINRSSTEKIFCGGKGLNVSNILGILGIKNTALAFIAGFTGAEIIQRMQKIPFCQPDFIELAHGISRINIKIKGSPETAINGLGPKIGTKELDKLFSRLKKLTPNDLAVLSGSIPPCLDNDIYAKIAAILYAQKVPFVIDAEAPLLTATLQYNPFLIKPNNDELSAICNKKLNTIEEIAAAALFLRQKGAKNVLVSLGAQGALLSNAEGQWIMSAPQGKLINSVGAGDSMVAGFIAGKMQKKSWQESLLLGIAAGSATAFSEGLATKEHISSLLYHLTRERIRLCK